LFFRRVIPSFLIAATLLSVASANAGRKRNTVPDYRPLVFQLQATSAEYVESSKKQVEEAISCTYLRNVHSDCIDMRGYLLQEVPRQLKTLRMMAAMSELKNVEYHRYESNYFPFDLDISSSWIEDALDAEMPALTVEEIENIKMAWAKAESRMRETAWRKLERGKTLMDPSRSARTFVEIDRAIELLKLGNWWRLLKSQNAYIIGFRDKFLDRKIKLNKKRVVETVSNHPIIRQLAHLDPNSITVIETRIALTQIQESLEDKEKYFEKLYSEVLDHKKILPIHLMEVFDHTLLVESVMRSNPEHVENIQKIQKSLFHVAIMEMAVAIGAGVALMWAPPAASVVGFAALHAYYLLDAHGKLSLAKDNASLSLSAGANLADLGNIYEEHTRMETVVYLTPLVAVGVPIFRFSTLTRFFKGVS
jgi:hypothetical protein